MSEKSVEKNAEELAQELGRQAKRKQKRLVPQSKIALFLSKSIVEFSMGLSQDTLTSNDGRLYPYQLPFCERIGVSVLMNDGDSITALFSRQSGKTTAISVMVSGLSVILPKLAEVEILRKIFPILKNFTRGVWTGIFAPILDQARTMYNKIRGNFASSSAEMILDDPEIADKVVTSNGSILALSSGSMIECLSASPTSNIESKTYHIIIIDEAQDVETGKLRKSISPMGAATNATTVMSGTPNGVHSAFYEQILQNKGHDSDPKIKLFDHFQYDYTIVQQYNDSYRKYILKEKAKYGEDSDEFRMSYKLEWIFERGMFTTFVDLKTRVYHPRLNRGDWDKFKGWSAIAGIDYGKSTTSTVLTLGVVNWSRPIKEEHSDYVFYKHAILDWLEIFGDDWDTQFKQIEDRIMELNIQRITNDATGLGAVMSDRLRARFPNIEVEDFVYSVSNKSDGYKRFGLQIRKGLIWVASSSQSQNTREWKQFNDQILTLQKEYKGQNLICEKPKDVRGAKDDYPDSAMTFSWAAREPVMSNFEILDSNIFAPNYSDQYQSSNYILRG